MSNPPAAPATSLHQLVARAASFDERRAASGERPTDAAAAVWAAHWGDVVGRGDPAAFARRLAWDGWQPDRLGWLTAEPPALPRWATLLDEWAAVSAAATGESVKSAAVAESGEGAVAFAAIAAPAATLLARHVAAGTPAGWAHLTAAARADLGRALIRRIATIGEPALGQAFETFRLARGAPADPADAVSGTALHDAFVARWTGQALFDALAPVPVLGRLWGTALAQAIDAAIEGLDRLVADAGVLAARFGAGAAAPIGALDVGRSDPHDHGRTVWRVTTTAGTTLYYKPRTLALDLAYGELVAWLAAAGLAHDLRAPEALDRGDYGWALAVAAAPLPEADAAARFFGRMGALVALAHALGANDLHAENLVAAGEHPVLVDLETLVPPRFADSSLEDVATQAGLADPAAVAHRLHHGVLDSLLVTWSVPNGTFGAFDLAPLGDPLPPGLKQLGWLDVGTDRLRRGEVPVVLAAAHLARWGGEPLRARDHLQALLTGFDAAYALLLARRDELLAPDGPLAAAADRPTRLLFRQTRHYGTLLDAGRAPDRLADGRLRSAGLDLLARTFVRQAERPPLWPLIGAERAALERLDIPYVAARTGSRDLVAEGVRLPDALPRAPIDDARARLRALSPADHGLQRRALTLMLGKTRAELAVTCRDAAEAEAGFDPLAAAAVLGDRLAEAAIRTADGQAVWLAALPAEDEARGRSVGALGVDLWAGTLGPALFLAALGRATGDARHTALACAAAGRAISAGRAAAAVLAAELGPVSAAGVAYGLARLAALLDGPAAGRAREAASAASAALVRALSPAALAAEPDPDMLGGLAGALAALLGVHAATGDPAALERAARCGEALLGRRERSPEPGHDGLAWRGRMGTFPAGYGHGQAGIAAQLLRLGEVLGDERFRAPALEALAFEATRFDAARGDWRVMATGAPPDAPPQFMAGWCHGAPGMALGRLAAQALAPAHAAELDAALATMAATATHLYDFPCCGSAGRIETWLEAARELERPDLAVRARALAAVMPGVAATPPASLEDADPRYLKGLSGVGWALLRVADPRLPCLLTCA